MPGSKDYSIFTPESRNAAPSEFDASPTPNSASSLPHTVLPLPSVANPAALSASNCPAESGRSQAAGRCNRNQSSRLPVGEAGDQEAGEGQRPTEALNLSTQAQQAAGWQQFYNNLLQLQQAATHPGGAEGAGNGDASCYEVIRGFQSVFEMLARAAGQQQDAGRREKEDDLATDSYSDKDDGSQSSESCRKRRRLNGARVAPVGRFLERNPESSDGNPPSPHPDGDHDYSTDGDAVVDDDEDADDVSACSDSSAAGSSDCLLANFSRPHGTEAADRRRTAEKNKAEALQRRNQECAQESSKPSGHARGVRAHCRRSRDQRLRQRRRHEGLDVEQRTLCRLLTVKVAALLAAANARVGSGADVYALATATATAATLTAAPFAPEVDAVQAVMPRPAAALPVFPLTGMEQGWPSTTSPTESQAQTQSMQITTIDGFFNRKRGRPPKNRFVEVYKNTQPTPQAIFTSFKLEKQTSSGCSTPIGEGSSTRMNSASTSTSANEPSSAPGGTLVSTIATSTANLPQVSMAASACWQQLQRQQEQERTAIEDTTAIETEQQKDSSMPISYVRRAYERCFRSSQAPLEPSSSSTASFALNEQRYSEGQPQSGGFAAKSRGILGLRMQRQQESENPTSHRYASFDRALGANCDIDECLQRKARPHHHCQQCRRQTPPTPAAPSITGPSYDDVGFGEKTANVVRAAGTFYPENSSSAPLPTSRAREELGCERPSCSLKRKAHVHCDLCQEPLVGAERALLHHRQCADSLEVPQDLRVPAKAGPCPPTMATDQRLLPEGAAPSSTVSPATDLGPHPNLAAFLRLCAHQQQQTPSLEALASYSRLDPLGQTIKVLGMLGGLQGTAVPSSLGGRKAQEAPLQGAVLGLRPKDERIPVGYLKFRFNEDCCFPRCGYRNHQSHFHCDRNDCHYSFCDKTRFVQHTARHERLDMLMGNDFRQFRANMTCGYEHCSYYNNLGTLNKASHFHCLKCDFICSDTNKVVAHRRQHSKMEYIRLAGFRKVASNESCSLAPGPADGVPEESCTYSMKQTHYHCLDCGSSVLSRAQLASHKHRKGKGSASSMSGAVPVIDGPTSAST